MRPICQVLLLPTEKEEEDGGFDIVRSVDGRSEGLRKEVEDVASFGELVDVPDISVSQGGLSDPTTCFGGEEDDVVRDQRSAARKDIADRHIRVWLLDDILVEADSLEPSLTLATSCALVDPDQLNPVPRFTTIYQIIRQDHLDSPRQLPRRRSFRHLLNTDRLMIPERTKTVFHGDRVALAVILRDHCGGRSCGEKGLGGDGAAIVVRPGMEMRGGLAVMDGFEHFGSDERACNFVWQVDVSRSSVSL
jgi:hypothetical protein